MATNRKRESARAQDTNGTSSRTRAETDNTLAFEEALVRLDETVVALESGQLPLQEALALFEEGVRLTQRCQELLDSAELRVERLRATRTQGTSFDGENDGTELLLEPFDLDEDE